MANNLNSICLDSSIRISLPGVDREMTLEEYEKFQLSSIADYNLSYMQDMRMSRDGIIRFASRFIDSAIRFSFILREFYIRSTTTKTVLASPVSMCIKAGGDVRAEMLLTNKIESTDKITIRSMDGNKMRNLDSN